MTSDAGLDDRNCSGIESLPRRRLERAEAWAGNERTASLVEMPGLVAWVHSAPSGPGAGGGDVHYLSLCPSGIVSRIALADVSGHGQSVVSFGEKLRELMLRHLTAIEQVGIMRDLNRAVQDELDGVHYATMVAVGWHAPRGLLVLTNAGHPSPCRFRAARGEWSWVERGSVSERGRTVGAPLGLLAESGYDRAVFKPLGGDLLLLYTDGVTEAVNEVGEELGRDGLMSILVAIEARSAEAVGGQFASALRLFRGSAEAADDETVIVLESVALVG
jgi:sigma-B regulation protein RsbU (phosphoserine phosphatase)